MKVLLLYLLCSFICLNSGLLILRFTALKCVEENALVAIKVLPGRHLGEWTREIDTGGDVFGVGNK